MTSTAASRRSGASARRAGRSPSEPAPVTMHPLSDHLVVDLSSGIAGAYCTKLLADGGAEVVKAAPPEGDPLRRWSASGADHPDGDDGALFTFLSSSQQRYPPGPHDQPRPE